MESLCYSANKESEDAYDVSTSLTNCSAGIHVHTRLSQIFPHPWKTMEAETQLRSEVLSACQTLGVFLCKCHVNRYAEQNRLVRAFLV